MKTLTVVRHAHAENARPGKDDVDRALSTRGQQEAALSAARFASAHPETESIISSPARRARATAEAFAQALGFDSRTVEYDERLYNASLDLLFEVLSSLDDSVRSVALIGHNPGVSNLVRELTDDPQGSELSTAATCSVRCEIDAWHEVRARCAKRLDD